MKWEITRVQGWEEAKKLSEEGWELCGIGGDAWYGNIYYFKRPLPDKELLDKEK